MAILHPISMDATELIDQYMLTFQDMLLILPRFCHKDKAKKRSSSASNLSQLLFSSYVWDMCSYFMAKVCCTCFESPSSRFIVNVAGT